MEALSELEDYVKYCKSKGWRVDNLESVCVRLFQEKRQTDHERELLFRFCVFFSRLERYPFYYQLIRDQPMEDLIRVDFYGSDINEFKKHFNRWKRLMV